MLKKLSRRQKGLLGSGLAIVGAVLGLVAYYTSPATISLVAAVLGVVTLPTGVWILNQARQKPSIPESPRVDKWPW